MEAPEVPLEKVQETLEHHAQSSEEKWISRVALSTAILAAFAAIASLLASDHSDEAMLEQIRASDQWSYYQAKTIKAAILGSKTDLAKSLSAAPNERDAQKLDTYAKEEAEIRANAEEKQKSAEEHLHKHVRLARATTMFQIAIAVGAISVLARRKLYWFVGLAFGAAGIALLASGLLA